MKKFMQKRQRRAATAVLGAAAVCFAALGIGVVTKTEASAQQSEDAKYYAPVGVASAGWAWDDVLSVSQNADQSVHVSFTDTSYVTIRTTSTESYSLDGLHLKIANFEGDGFGIAFSNIAAPDSNENAIRLYPCNLSDNAYMRASYPNWDGLTVLDRLEKYPMSSDFDIRVEKAESGWDFIFDGQTFHFTDEAVAEAIPDTSSVYISFAGMGGSSYVNTFSFDYVSVHGGDERCADTLTNDEKNSIEEVNALIDNIGKVSYTTNSATKINAANQAYNALSADLKPMIQGYDTLVYAQQNYYALGNPVVFDESNIVSDFYVVTDNHLDTNDCTTYADGSPQDRFNLVLDMVSKASPDALLLAGDTTDWARFDETADLSTAHKQINMMKDSLDTYWSGDSALFFTMGNHDSSESEGESRVELFYEILGDKYYASDVNKTETEWSKGYRHAKIAGFDYLTVEWDYSNENQNISDEAIAWLKSKLEQITSASDYDGKPIFFLSHVPFNNTVDGSNSGAETLSKQKLFKVLENYPQLVMITGHSHYPISTEKFVYQDAFTHLGAATTAYIGMDDGSGYLDDGGYHLASGSYRPKDMLQAEGLYLEIDKDYNIRITRIDFMKDGSPIWNTIIIPSPDLQNKTHLNYYSEARASRVEAPVYTANETLDAKLVSANELELTFDTLLSEGVVQEYEIEITNAETTLFYQSYQATWRYINADLVPDKKTVVLENFTMAKPYTINVCAVDSFGNKSNALTYTISANVADDMEKAAAVDALIDEIGEITEDNQKVVEAMTAYQKLSYDQKIYVEKADVLLEAYEKYENLFKTLEEYEYGVSVESTVLGQNYWLGGMMEYYDDEKGIVIEYINGVPNVRMGLKPFDLDGLHLTFDKLIKDDAMTKDPSIGIILGGTPHPQYTEPNKTGILLFFDTNIGKIEAHPGGQIIVRGDELKYRNLKDKQFDIKFTALEEGGFKVECQGLVGKIDESYFDGSFSLKNTAKTFISLSNWVDNANFSYRLLAVHGGNDDCAGFESVAISQLNNVDNTIKAINTIGNVELDDESKIVYAEGLYSSLPESLKGYVENYATLQEARALLNILKAEQGTSDGPNTDKSDEEEKGGCKSSMGIGALVLPMLVLGVAIKIKRKEK